MAKRKPHLDNINNWKTCPPSRLGDLFFQIDNNKANRLTTFKLSKAGRNALSKVKDVSCLRIHMSCSKNKNKQEIFTPWLGVVTGSKKKQKEKFYKMNAFTATDPTVGKTIANQPLSFVQILPTTSNLFRLKWLELKNEEVSNAFTGYTVKSIKNMDKKNKNHPPTNMRVSFYEFVQSDAERIVKRLQEKEEDQLYMHLGAGLQVEIFHPFDFRPVIQVGTISGNGFFQSGNGDDDDDYYERSQPCPPYCSGGEG